MTAPRGHALLGGVSVLVITAIGCFWGFARPGTSWGVHIVGIILLVGLLASAVLLARFIRRHGDEIGEARFDTRNKDGNEG
jgi:hypothetical protein